MSFGSGQFSTDRYEFERWDEQNSEALEREAARGGSFFSKEQEDAGMDLSSAITAVWNAASAGEQAKAHKTLVGILNDEQCFAAVNAGDLRELALEHTDLVSPQDEDEE